MQSAITITFGDQAENGPGMEKLGRLATKGFSLEDLERIKHHFSDVEIVDLKKYAPHDGELEFESAYVLIARGGVNDLLKEKKLTADDMYDEQNALETDKKAFMRGRVVNKHARSNLCFGRVSQVADFENKKGTIVAWDDVPITSAIKNKIENIAIDEKHDELQGEGNYYFDPDKCGIGFHGDGERKKVIAVRLGVSIPLHYQWFHRGLPVGKRCELKLEHGDIYFMSEKAVGFDWMKKIVTTLRHSAGCKKYTTIKAKKKKQAEEKLASGKGIIKKKVISGKDVIKKKVISGKGIIKRKRFRPKKTVD